MIIRALCRNREKKKSKKKRMALGGKKLKINGPFEQKMKCYNDANINLEIMSQEIGQKDANNVLEC